MGIFFQNTIKISNEMLNLITEIDEFKGAWVQFGKLTPHRLSSLKKVATMESIGSSTRIEGAKLSDKDVEKLLYGVEKENYLTRDEQEVAGYALVCERICNDYSFMPISENIIKQLHIWLLQYTEKDKRHRGEYKKIPVRIEAFDNEKKSLGVIFETVSPLETPIKMQELISWTNQAFEQKKIHPLIIIAIFIVIFLAIHPFQDGNGRLSRLLTTLLTLKCGYIYTPYSSLESVIEANKEAYYLALQKTQKNWRSPQVDWKPWLMFFFQCLQRQKRHLEVKLEKEKILLHVLPPLYQKILDVLESHGKLTIKELVVLTNANRNTIKKTLSSLVQNNEIIKHGIGKGTWYSLG